jgi:hypothetical protein
MVAPVLAGEADYVVGSRFAGSIGRMLPHRRFGNQVLTAVLRAVTGLAITDGQSGYRALAPWAAAEARIPHDYNYAQVLTIDLLQRSARYHEVPISYAFRSSGRSFVRLGPYLAHVVPTVLRQLRSGGRGAQSSTTWPAKRARATVHAARSNDPVANASAAAHA